jgi:hypothetical protein
VLEVVTTGLLVLGFAALAGGGAWVVRRLLTAR